MTPREFEVAYGLPVTTKLTGSNIEPIRIQPNADRYLIVFQTIGSDIGVSPDSNWSDSTDWLTISAGSGLTIFTHALHGALVNCGWTIRVLGVIGTFAIYVTEGRMSPIITVVERGKTSEIDK